jgi:predicted RNase H-like HicB family nuclease
MTIVMPTLQDITVTLMLEPQESGRFIASVMEFPACRVEADSREAAIAHIKTSLSKYVSNVELIRWVISVPLIKTDPIQPTWLKFAGVFKDDPDFAAIMDELRAERESDDESEVDPAYYLEA